MPNDRLLVMLEMVEDLLARIRVQIQVDDAMDEEERNAKESVSREIYNEGPSAALGAPDPDTQYAEYVASATKPVAGPSAENTIATPVFGADAPDFLRGLRVPAGRPLSRPEDER
jgi:hypothetical protein